MCGIYCAIQHQQPVGPDSKVERLLRQRGPDHFGRAEEEFTIPLDDQASRKRYITFAASVLALRRDANGLPIAQPLKFDNDRGFLCWNGEAWKYDNECITGSDTQFIAARLARMSNDASDFHNETLQVLEKIRGPFAFIYYNKVKQLLYYGRDCVGRRSLLQTLTEDGTFVLSSVADLTIAAAWSDVDADGIYTIDLVAMADIRNKGNFISRTPYSNARINGETCIKVPWSPLNMSIPDPLPPGATSITSSHKRLHTASPAVQSLLRQLTLSMELRLPERTRADHPPIAILFSGGLDCTLLARLAHEALHKNTPIDLLNVAFENPRIHKNVTADGTSAYETCPDRITARHSLAELQRVCPDRVLNLVCINIPYAESLTHQEEIKSLIHPHNTEMDVSIAMALYFGSRGPTASKVLFSGLGADELFGGYQRHALAFKRGGYQGLLGELLLDMERLGRRNLGRDDRVTARWGREVRYPFLDEDVIGWAMEARIWEKLGFGFGEVEGKGMESVKLDDKLVLRCIAKKLGMTGVADEKKRAIQFGSRSAKMESGRTKGTEKVS